MAALCRLCQRSIWPHDFVTTIAFFFPCSGLAQWLLSCQQTYSKFYCRFQSNLNHSKWQLWTSLSFSRILFLNRKIQSVFLNCVRFERSLPWKVTVWLHFLLFLRCFWPSSSQKLAERNLKLFSQSFFRVMGLYSLSAKLRAAF